MADDVKERLRQRSIVRLPVDEALAHDALVLIEEYEVAARAAIQMMRLTREYVGQHREQSLALMLAINRVISTPEFMTLLKRHGVGIDG